MTTDKTAQSSAAAEKVKFAVEAVRVHLDSLRTNLGKLHEAGQQDPRIKDVQTLLNKDAEALESSVTELASVTK